MNNKHLFHLRNEKLRAKKLPVYLFYLGQFKDLYDSKYELPFSKSYLPEDHIVVRVVGNNVSKKGRYDILALSKEEAEKLCVHELDVMDSMTIGSFLNLVDVFLVSPEVQAYTIPEKEYTVLLINGLTIGYNEYAPDTPIRLFKGDVFVVTDEKKYTGYRISKKDFEEDFTVF